MIRADGTLHTNDMTLVAVLACYGLSPSLELGQRRGKAVGVWTMPASDVNESVRTLVDEYMAGKIRVEPARFMREVKAVRNQLYRFLEHHGLREAREPRAQAS